MECDCEEVTSCEGIPHPVVQKERAKPVQKISNVIDRKIEPLFSLPAELMKCILCERKHEKRRKRNLRETYTEKRLKVEDFRRFMVGLIAKTELPGVNIDLNNDKDVNRYYNYICNGVDTVHAVKIQDDILRMILSLVPSHLRGRFEYLTEGLLFEIKAIFTENIKKAILEYALRDPMEDYLSQEKTTQNLLKIKRSLPGLSAAVQGNRETLRQILYLINPCMRMSLEHWVGNFRDFRLFDLKQIAEHERSWDLLEFEKTIHKHIVKARKVLRDSWYSGIQDIFLVNNRKQLVPSPLQRTRFKGFYDCIAKIMESQLLAMCKWTLRDFMDLIIRGQPIDCEFNVDIVVSSNQLTFSPSFEEFKEVLCGLLDEICQAIRRFHKLQTQLYLDWSGPEEILKPQIDESIVEKLKREIIDLIDRERIIPEQILMDLQMYEHLYNDEEYKMIERYVKDENKKLDDYNEAMRCYEEQVLNLPVQIERTAFTGLFKVSRKIFVEAIVANVRRIKSLLTDTLVDRYQDTAKKAAEEYQAISDRALSAPANTAELMDLKSFMKTVIDVSLKNLEQDLCEIIVHILLLSDYRCLTDVEISTNNIAFQWYHKVPQILEENEVIVANKTIEFQQALKVRYVRFEEELESYAKQVDEIQYWGDIEDVHKYQKRTQNLENRLIAAMEKIDKFNEEETSFGWDITQYPRRKQIADHLKPYKQLFDAICDFLTKHDLWINTMIGSYNPEDIDNDVGYAYRTIYKLEKAFQEPDLKELAGNVREKIEEFRERMPIVFTLGNPGLKARHWDEISAIIGVPIKVDADLTLARILDMGLDLFVEKFESISDSASKESTLERAMDKMQKDWTDLAFTVNPFKDTGTFVIAGVDDIQLLLDDHIIKTVTIKNSPNIKPFEARIL